MRLTVDIPDHILAEAMVHTGVATRAGAVLLAFTDTLVRRRADRWKRAMATRKLNQQRKTTSASRPPRAEPRAKGGRGRKESWVSPTLQQQVDEIIRSWRA